MARRKTAKKAGYKTYSFCYDRDSDTRGKWADALGGGDSLQVELGCGRAAMSLGLARRYPNEPVVGVDLKTDRMWHAAGEVAESGLTNIGFLHVHIEKLADFFNPGEISGIWITFPDPFPKKRYAKHRLVHPRYIEIYKSMIRPGGIIQFKTDNLELFQYALQVLVLRTDIRFHALTFDLHTWEDAPEETKILTAYERKWMEQGLKINYLAFSYLNS